MEHLYLNTYDSFPLTERIMEMMRSAKRYIKTGNFMFREPVMKQEILNALNRGVVVFIISNLGEDEERLIASYKPILSDTLAQSLNLENIKKANIAEIEGYRQKLNEADDEIQKKKERLLLEYLVRIKEIARDYDKSLTRNKEKIKNDDILNSTIVDIFKNSSL